MLLFLKKAIFCNEWQSKTATNFLRINSALQKKRNAYINRQNLQKHKIVETRVV